MSQRPLELGSHGQITFRQRGSRWSARCRYRDFDGVTRSTEAAGKTKGAALQALQRDLKARLHGGQSDLLGPDTLFSVAAEKWFSELDRAISTKQNYRDRLDKQVLPALGNVRLRELSVGLVDRHLRAIQAKHGASLAKTTKSVISGVCGLAARHDAIQSNPCRDVARISVKVKKEKRALAVAEVRAIRAWFYEDERAKRLDLPDLVTFLAGTGLRIGEALAISWSDVDLEVGTVSVHRTVVRVKGHGLTAQENPKTRAGERIVEPPSWCLEMLRRRLGQPDEWVFPTPGRWAAQPNKLRDPTNVHTAFRNSFAGMGVTDVTSHTFRRTVATLMDEAGLSARATADQLGHARPSLTQDIYMVRRQHATGAAAVLEVIGGNS